MSLLIKLKQDTITKEEFEKDFPQPVFDYDKWKKFAKKCSLKDLQSVARNCMLGELSEDEYKKVFKK